MKLEDFKIFVNKINTSEKTRSIMVDIKSIMDELCMSVEKIDFSIWADPGDPKGMGVFFYKNLTEEVYNIPDFYKAAKASDLEVYLNENGIARVYEKAIDQNHIIESKVTLVRKIFNVLGIQ